MHEDSPEEVVPILFTRRVPTSLGRRTRTRRRPGARAKRCRSSRHYCRVVSSGRTRETAHEELLACAHRMDTGESSRTARRGLDPAGRDAPESRTNDGEKAEDEQAHICPARTALARSERIRPLLIGTGLARCPERLFRRSARARLGVLVYSTLAVHGGDFRCYAGTTGSRGGDRIDTRGRGGGGGGLSAGSSPREGTCRLRGCSSREDPGSRRGS